MAPLVLMLDVVVVVGVTIDFFFVVVNDDDVSVIFFRTTTTTIPCRTLFNATLPHPSNYIPPVQFNPTNSTLINHFRSITPITIYHTRFALLRPSYTTLHIPIYPVHLTLTHPKCKKQKERKNTNGNKN